MTSRFDVLTQQLFQKNIADCSVDELEELAGAYPYFAPAQYALLLKFKETDYSSYEKQFQKTILYYHEPPGFDQFINEDEYEVDDRAFVAKETLAPEEIESPVVESFVEQNIITEEKENTEENKITDAPAIDAGHAEEIIVEEKEVAETEGEVKPEINEPAEQESIVSQIKEPEPETPVVPKEIPDIKSIKEPAVGDTALAFEPYHTVDYFASQGIKLSQEEVTKDKFGKQLKSFTEWLKTMKKLPAVDQANALDTAAEQKVETCVYGNYG
jgi:hypothetical protein